MKTRVIKNFDALATTKLRRDALEIAEAGYEAIDLKTMFARQLDLRGEHLVVGNQRYDLSKYRNVYIVGVGKGSALAVESIGKVLKKRVTKGFAIDIKRRLVRKIRVFAGTHPLPSDQNITATNHIIKLMKGATKDDLVIAAICGGGSSLFCQPAGLTCVELQHVSSYLLKAGAKIQEINTVRKHLSLIHGGYFAKYAYPATVLGLIISDVPGDDLNFVASGPTVLDKTTRADAEKIAFGKRWFQDICRVHAAARRARPDKRVQFINEHDNLAVGLAYFGDDGFQPLLELPPETCSRHQCAHVERYDNFRFQRFRHVARNNPLGNSLDNRRFAHARLAD